MSFEQAVVAVLSRYARFRGRARPAEYWWWQLLLLLVLIAAIALSGLSSTAAGWFFLLTFLGLIVPSLAVTARRVQDVGLSPLWLLACIPVPILVVPLIFLLAWPGTPGPNAFGPPPAGSARTEPEPAGSGQSRAFERTTRIPVVRRR
jgi:uncharacterized membrane protein YhaH (DUF805 family)